MSDARQVNMWKHDYLIALVTSLATMMTRRSKKKKKQEKRLLSMHSSKSARINLVYII